MPPGAGMRGSGHRRVFGGRYEPGDGQPQFRLILMYARRESGPLLPTALLSHPVGAINRGVRMLRLKSKINLFPGF
jgi:hypothetical protein